MLYVWHILAYSPEFPQHVIIKRQHVLADEVVFEQTVCLCNSISQAREIIPRGLVRFARHKDDEKWVVEAWL